MVIEGQQIWKKLRNKQVLHQESLETDSVSDPMMKAFRSKRKVKGACGIIYDDSCMEHLCLWAKHPECPERYSGIIKRCSEMGLLERCTRLTTRKASKEEVLSVHSEKHFSMLESTSGESDHEKLEVLSSKYDSIYFHPRTFEITLLAAGSAIELVHSILTDVVDNGMAIVRPPGHHVPHSVYNGYCYFNNVALAATHALDNFGLSRILIVDWDVHHGQGTQQLFYEDPRNAGVYFACITDIEPVNKETLILRVLYFSIHRYCYGTFWPELQESDFNYIGKGAGIGFNFNVPINQAHMKNEDYLAIFQQVLLPVAYEFNPELVIISAGYDAAFGCFEGFMDLTPAIYAHFTSNLMTVSAGKVAVVLEKLYWKCLCYQGEYSIQALETSRRASLLFEETYKPSLTYEGPTVKPTVYSTRENFPPEMADLDETAVAIRLNQLRGCTNLSTPAHSVCLIYDSVMEHHFNELSENFPECPARTQEIMKCFKEFEIIDRVLSLKPRRARESELLLIHKKNYLDIVKSSSKLEKSERLKLQRKYTSIYVNSSSYEAAITSAGCLLEVVDTVCQGISESGVAVIRPPGHHAEEDFALGFCFFSNVAIAASYALKKYNMKRVMIVDWDVHHGNGTQHAFESDPRVLYVSIHMYQNAGVFPFSKDANYNNVGKEKGEGFIINIPWYKKHKGDAEYISAMLQVILPIGYQFNPELVIVSAGFDCAINDPLGGCCVTPECFGHMTRLLMPLAGGKIILALEGGYNLTSTRYSMTMCAKALLGDPIPALKSNLVPNKDAVATIREVIATHSAYWSALRFQVCLPMESVLVPDFPPPLAKIVPEFMKYGSADSSEEYETPPGTPTPEDEDPGKSLETEVNLLSITDRFKGDDSGLGAVGGSEHPSTRSEGQFYSVVPLSWCPHLNEVSSLLNIKLDAKSSCEICKSSAENWVCLVCFKVFCSRFINEHMVFHGVSEEHNIVLSYSDLSVWCYSCNAYIDNSILHEAKNAAYSSKFGTAPYQ